MTPEIFEAFFDLLIASEGGFVDHPDDPGGATRWGVTERVARSNGYTGRMQDFPIEQARAIYFKAYFQAASADKMPAPIAFNVFDAAVNHGVGLAIRLAQKALGVADDGKVGAQTIAAAQAIDPWRFLAKFNAQRADLYNDLRHFNTFGRGWTQRLVENTDHTEKLIDGGIR